VLTMVGAALLWVGWFGFNAGSNLEANGTAAMAILNTILAPAAAMLAWAAAEWMTRGKPSMLGMASGIVAGLVAITPAAGFSGPMGAIAIGLVVGVVAFWGVGFVKRTLKIDDSLDVFAVHGLGGIVGAIGTGIVANPALGGSGVFDYAANAVAEFSPVGQVISQLWGVGIAVLWSGVVSFILFKLIDMLMGLRVSEEDEREGLDTSSHGERAYSN
ncbi:MAG TPA: ammonium transporter, partial [bacterium]|nr:ammonium transporter [bacterium]